ncbi:MAG: hypothetical protein HKP55_10445 [Gammaproteobacteria bacterium]|nr:hypothetical protein [Gammaproteobacteria bacterium]
MQTQVKTEAVGKVQSLSRGKKLVLMVFVIWAAQAIPKWTIAITADGETAAKIVGIFITPKYQQIMVNHSTGASSEISLDT